MTVEEMRLMKYMSHLTNKDLATQSGIPLGTVQKIMAGNTRNPRRKTLDSLEQVLTRACSAGKSTHEDADIANDTLTHYTPYSAGSTSSIHRQDIIVHESGALYNTVPDHPGILPQGNLHASDLKELPDDLRAELIDGVLIRLESPSNLHQRIALCIAEQFDDYIAYNHGNCEVFIAPSGVQLDKEDDTTVLQPDLYLLCDSSKEINAHTVGAPDLVLEILSPSTIKRDFGVKKDKYRQSGVREYWIVNPKTQQILTFWFVSKDSDISTQIGLYGFHHKIPVRIYDNKCEIDFEKVWKRISRYY